MDPIRESYDQRLRLLLDETASIDITDDNFPVAAKNLSAFAAVRAVLPEPEPVPDPVPATRWGRFKAGAATVWDNETTRVFIKAGGAFAGVGLVVWSTVRRDHVLDKTAMNQANQRNS